MVSVANDPPSQCAFAYRVPLNPYAPVAGEFSTLVRTERIQVRDRLHLSWTETEGELRTVRGSPDEWEVVAIEPAGDEGRKAAIMRGKSGPDAVWDGTLVVRKARG
jgi:hypothetical protein